MAMSNDSQETNLNPLTLSAPDTPANPSAKPESEREQQTSAIFGLKLRDSLAYFDPATCSWKTFQDTFLSGLETYSETWPDSGTMRNGVVTELRTSAPAICESESLSWPTAQAHDGGGMRGNTMADHHHYPHDLSNAADSWPTVRSTSGGGNRSAYEEAPYRPAIAQIASQWPTARAEDSESCGNHPGTADSLTGVTRHWVTPQAHQAGANSKRENREGTGGPDLKEQTEHWNTPHGMSNRDFRGKVGGCGGGEFANQANNWQTPQSRDHKSGESLQDYGNSRPLNEQVLEFSHLAPVIPDGPPSSLNSPTSRRRLNPRFVEWLMGFPIGWTELCKTGLNDSPDSETPLSPRSRKKLAERFSQPPRAHKPKPATTDEPNP